MPIDRAQTNDDVTNSPPLALPPPFPLAHKHLSGLQVVKDFVHKHEVSVVAFLKQPLSGSANFKSFVALVSSATECPSVGSQ